MKTAQVGDRVTLTGNCFCDYLLGHEGQIVEIRSNHAHVPKQMAIIKLDHEAVNNNASQWPRLSSVGVELDRIYQVCTVHV